MSKEKIKNAIDAVEPEAGAKERMYQNIMKKALKQADHESKPGGQKKLTAKILRYALPVAACLCLAATGIFRLAHGKTPDAPGESSVQIANPFVEVNSADDFKAIGVALDAPAGAENIAYTIIDNRIADVVFEIGGMSFTVRASAQSGDFSGLFGTEETLETVDARNNAVLSVVKTDNSEYFKVTWTNGKVNYCLYGADGAGVEQVRAVYEALKK